MADTSASHSRVRTGGSGFTLFTFAGQPIAFAQQIEHVSPQPVAAPVAIHPMDEPYPVQVITPAAAGMGSLTLNLYELYNSKVWDRLGAQAGDISDGDAFSGVNQFGGAQPFGGALLSGAVDIVDIFIRIAAAPPGSVNVVKYIRPPALGGALGGSAGFYAEQYHGCVVTNVTDGEQINVGSMDVIKQVTVGYTYMTRGSKKSAAWSNRDVDLGDPNRGAS